MHMAQPPHPGGVIQRLYLDPLGLSVAQAAERMGADPIEFALLIDGHGAITSVLAEQLSATFGRSVESWLAMQAIYERGQTA